MIPRKTYYIISGEGENGTWKRVETTEIGIKQRLARERCGGMRWAVAYTDAYITAEGSIAAWDVEDGSPGTIPYELARGVK